MPRIFNYKVLFVMLALFLVYKAGDLRTEIAALKNAVTVFTSPQQTGE
jgi:hypothetical protein